MSAVNDPTLLALIESMEVQVNRMEDERRQREIYERGVVAMREASNKESQ